MSKDLHEEYARLKALILAADAKGDTEKVIQLRQEQSKVYAKLAAAAGHSHESSDDEDGDDEDKGKKKSRR